MVHLRAKLKYKKNKTFSIFLLKIFFEFFQIGRSTMMLKTRSRRRQHRKDAKNYAKTVQNDPKTVQNGLKQSKNDFVSIGFMRCSLRSIICRRDAGDCPGRDIDVSNSHHNDLGLIRAIFFSFHFNRSIRPQCFSGLFLANFRTVLHRLAPYLCFLASWSL